MNILLACFFVSGFGSLVYETLWTRHLTHVIGGSPYAVSIILSVFMGGLGLGGALGGRLADRLARPGRLLQAYGVLELFIGLYALALPTLLSLCRPVFAAVYSHWYASPFLYNTVVFSLCAALLILPVLCMGATLPLLGKYCVRGPDRVGGPLSFLYAVNTLGAAAGVLTAGFWLFPALGLKATTLIAAALNGAVGALCMVLGGRAPREAAPEMRAEASRAAGPAKAKGPGGNKGNRGQGSLNVTEAGGSAQAGFRAALIVFAVSGFCAMAYEVTWTKVLTLIMGPTTHAFTLVLAVFITGLALGGWAFGRISDRVRNPAWLLAVTQGGAALLALAAGQRMGNSLFLFQKIDFQFQDRFIGSLAVKSLFLFAFMLAPTFLLGAAFPLTMRLAARAGERLGRSVGTAYAVNTFGGVLGAWIAGFLMIPRLGSERSLGALAAVQLIAAAALAFAALRSRGKEGKRVWRLLGSVAASALAIALCLNFPSWDRVSLGRAANRIPGSAIATTSWLDAFFGRHPASPVLIPEEQVFYGDGIGGFTSVWRTLNLLGNHEYGLFVSGKADASSRLDMFTQVLLCQFPMVLHPHPKKVMVLGLASGITAGEALKYDIDRLDVLEINPQVAEASGFFKPWNGALLEDSRTHLILQDAKAHLLLSREKYDVIISEPSNPWMAGLAELFTKEFFQRARDHLEEGGVMVEFLHSYQMDWETFSMVGRTFAQVFPNGMLVRTMPDDRRLPGSASDYLLVGIKGTGRPGLAGTPEKREALARSTNLRLADPRLFYRLLESENLPGLFGPGPINTDNLPLLEFSAPRLRFTFDSRAIEAAIAAGPPLSDSTRALRDSLRADPESRLEFAEYALSVSKPFPGMMDWPAATPPQRQQFTKSLDAYCSQAHVTDWEFLDDAEMKTRCSVVQMAALNRNLKSGGSAAVYLAMAEVCLVNGVPANAMRFYGKALESAGENSYVGRQARLRLEEVRGAFGDGPTPSGNAGP
ncbi:MAG: spermine/spermidine synthase family protein [Fibrobacteres bacterium]|nr:spermine/spermidine synthase family protein [Fibrobacterota bacterium]